MSYKSEIIEAALVSKRKDIDAFFKELNSKLSKVYMVIKKNEESLGSYSDASLMVNKKIYAFRFITSKYPVSLNSNKFWKVKRSTGSGMGDRFQKNPMKWFPETVKADYYIYPVKNPENTITYNKTKEFVGNYDSAIEFIVKKIEKDA